jgi:hypothetical protein
MNVALKSPPKISSNMRHSTISWKNMDNLPSMEAREI